MDTLKKIYILQPESDSIKDIEAIFDDLEKVNDYNNRYKTESSFEIITYVLNPEYETDKTKDPYLVQISRNSIEDASVCLDHADYNIEDASIEAWTIRDSYSEQVNSPIFSVSLFAGSGEEALKRAVEIRDSKVSSEDWSKAEKEIKLHKARALRYKPYTSKTEKLLKTGLATSSFVIMLLILYIALT